MSFILSSHLLFSPSTTTSTTTATTTNPPAIPSPIVTGNFILTINYRLIVNGPQWEEKCEKIRNMILTSMANWKNGVRSGFMTVSCCPSLPVRHTNHHSINFFTSPRTDFCINFTFQSNQCPCEWHSDSFAALQMAWYDELKKIPTSFIIMSATWQVKNAEHHCKTWLPPRTVVHQLKPLMHAKCMSF